jgi:hypothetical protein
MLRFEIKGMTMERDGIHSETRTMWIILQKGKKAMYCRSVDFGRGSITSFTGNSECYEFYL